VGEVVRALPIFVFSYTCHQNIISSTNELHNPTPARAAAGMISAVSISLLTYIVLATAGYLTFGDTVKSDILESYPSSSKVVAVSRIGVSIIVTLCYPLQAHPTRGFVTSICHEISESLERRRRARLGSTTLTDPLATAVTAGEQAADDDDHGGGKESSVGLYLAITTTFLLASTGIALVVKDLGMVLKVVGATGSTTVSYILPGACYVALFREDGGAKWRFAMLILVLGCIIMPLSLTLVFIPDHDTPSPPAMPPMSPP